MFSMPVRSYDDVPQKPIDRLRPLREDPIKRLKTFKDFPKSAQISPVDLCNDGFFYVGNGCDDRIQCAYCGGILKNLHKDDNIRGEHSRIFGRCPYVNGNNDISFTGQNTNFLFCTENNNNGEISQIRPTKITTRSPSHPQFSTKSARLSTYKNWPSSMKQRPDELSEAGLFYTGESDKTICYHCGGLLEEWESDDVPQTEHDNWFPDCYLAQKRHTK